MEIGIEKLIGAFAEEVKTELDRVAKEKDAPTNNGRPMDAWDLRFKNIKKAAIELGLLCKIIRVTTLWSYAVVINKNKGYLFTKKLNLDKVLLNKEKDPLHYVLCTVAINKHLNGKGSDEQIELLEDLNELDKKAKRSKYYGKTLDKVDEIIVFTLEEFQDEAVKVNELYINAFGNIVTNIDRSNDIDENYNNIMNQEKVDKSELLVGLKENLEKEKEVSSLKEVSMNEEI